MPRNKLYGVFTLVLYSNAIPKSKMNLVVFKEDPFKTGFNGNFYAFGNLSNHCFLVYKMVAVKKTVLITVAKIKKIGFKKANLTIVFRLFQPYRTL